MTNNLKAIIASVSLIVLSNFLNITQAQKASDFLPENTFMAFSINGESLQNKMSLESIQNLDFYKELRKELEREGLSGNLSDIGVDLDKEMTFFGIPEGDYMVLGMIIPLSGDNLTSLLQLRDTKVVNGVTYQSNYGEFIGYNDSYLIFADAEVTAPYPGWGATEEENAAYNLIYENKISFIESFGPDLFKSKTKGLSKDKNFISSYESSADANFYMSLTSEFAEQYMNMTGLAGDLLLGTNMADPMKNLTSGNQYWSSQLYFEEDQILVDSKFFPNEENMKIQKAISKSKLNSDLLKYISQDNLLGVYNVNLNTEEALNLTPQYFSPLIDYYLPVEKAGNKIASLIGTVLDEEALGEMINGNLIVAVSNLSMKETQFISYEYDEEYNMTESVQTGTDLIPDVLGIIQSSNSKNLTTILELATIESPLIKEENYFMIPAGDGLDFAFYIFTTTDGLFFTNSKPQMELILSGKGYDNINKSLAKDLKKNAQNVFINTNMIFKSIPIDEESPRFEDKAIDYLRANTTSIRFSQAKPKGDSVRQKMTIAIPEKSYENSLQYIFNVINDIYKIGEN